jgi:hypothetical protein
VPITSRLFPTFSCISFTVSGFMWSSLINFDLTLVQGDRNGSIPILLHDNSQLWHHQLLKMLFFSLDGLSSLIKDQWPLVCGFISGPSTLFHRSTCLSLDQYHVVRHGDSTRGSFIIEKSFCYPRFLLFQMNLQIALSNSLKNWVGILMRIALMEPRWWHCLDDTFIRTQGSSVPMCLDREVGGGMPRRAIAREDWKQGRGHFTLQMMVSRAGVQFKIIGSQCKCCASTYSLKVSALAPGSWMKTRIWLFSSTISLNFSL